MFKEDTYIVGAWLAEIPPMTAKAAPEGGDISAWLYRDPGETDWKLRVRIRYYCKEEKNLVVWRNKQSKDRSTHVEQRFPGTIPEPLIQKRVDDVITGMAAEAAAMGLVTSGKMVNHPPSFFAVHGDAKKLLELSESGKAPSWFHLTKSAVGEEDKLPPKYTGPQN